MATNIPSVSNVLFGIYTHQLTPDNIGQIFLSTPLPRSLLRFVRRNPIVGLVFRHTT